MIKKLKEIPDKSPFKVPENYFEEINRKIIAVTTGDEHEVRKVSISDRFRTAFLVAASIAGLILISYTAVKLFIPRGTNSHVSETLQNISTETYINDIDISSLEEDASSLNLSDDGPDVTSKEIIDYLLLENIELNEIYEQL